MAKLYSLLVGITDYPAPYGLNECVRDVEKVSDYIADLEQSFYDEIKEPIVLINKDATKAKIASNLSKILNQLSEDDTFIFYFSGHGAEELAPGRFREDHNGLIQTLVCYYEKNELSNQLLADKELRYLFNKSQTDAQIVAIFDCCHSGDVTRALDKGKNIKRLTAKYPERPYEDFLFSREIQESTFKDQKFNDIFPDINLISLSACASKEFSWENSEGGYFTRALLQSLNFNNNSINYGDLSRECRILIQNMTLEKQTPVIDVLGNKEYNQLTSWLRLNGNKLTEALGFIKYYKSKGWIYSRGSLNGVKVGDSITINSSQYQDVEIRINKVNLSESYIDDPIYRDLDLEKSQKYPVILNDSLPALKLAIVNLDGDLRTEKVLTSNLDAHEKIELSKVLYDCDFQANVFNELIYFSKVNDPYRPLNKQFDLVNEAYTEEEIESRINDYLEENLEILDKWNKIQNLNLGEGFEIIPIKVEIKYQDNEWSDITNGNLTIQPQGRNMGGNLFRHYEVKVTNISEEDLYITVLSLYDSCLEISNHAFDKSTILLQSGKYKHFDPPSLFLDHFQEIYNWEGETVEFKFVVNNYFSPDAGLAILLQDGFLKPITHFGTQLGGGKKRKITKRPKDAIYTSKIFLENSTYNQISGELLSNIKWYEESEQVLPFIEKLYFDIQSEDFNYDLTNKPSASEEAYKGSIKMNIGNFIDYTRRNRKFKKMRRQYPEKDIIVAEGDSWFLYPILVKDTIDYIMESWPVKNLAWAGDTLENYKKSGQLIETVKKLEPHPKYVLISGGGNDIIGKEIRGLLIKNAKNIQSPRDYLNSQYDQQIQKLEDFYKYFFDELSKISWVEKILVHGYDYIRADHAGIVVKGGWLNKYLIEYGITEVGERTDLIRFLIDEFNTKLESISSNYPKVKYLDLRQEIKADQWFDEIHPNDIGYKKVADKFMAELTQ